MKNSYIIYIFVFFLSSCISTNQVFFSDPNYLKSDEFSSTETIIEGYSENDSSIEVIISYINSISCCWFN